MVAQHNKLMIAQRNKLMIAQQNKLIVEQQDKLKGVHHVLNDLKSNDGH